MNEAKSAFGTKIKRAGVPIAGLTSIGGVELSMETIDVTNHDSVNGFKEFIGGLIETGEIPIEGQFYAGDTTGQIGLMTDMINRTLQTFALEFPDALATNWLFTALVTKFKVGDAELDEAVPFSAELKPSGQPVLSVSASAGLTTPFFTVSGEGTLIVPAAAGNVYEYVIDIPTGISSVTITSTAATGTITITVNGASQVVASGQASTAIALGAAGSVTVATISVQENGKTAKVYTLHLARAAA